MSVQSAEHAVACSSLLTSLNIVVHSKVYKTQSSEFGCLLRFSLWSWPSIVTGLPGYRGLKCRAKDTEELFENQVHKFQYLGFCKICFCLEFL